MRTVIFVAVIVTVVAIGCGGRDGLLRDADGNTYVLRDMNRAGNLGEQFA